MKENPLFPLAIAKLADCLRCLLSPFQPNQRERERERVCAFGESVNALLNGQNHFFEVLT